MSKLRGFFTELVRRQVIPHAPSFNAKGIRD